MSYLKVFAISLLTIALAYFSMSLLLAPAPISAEYWVREMTVVKRSIALRYQGQRKLIIAAGSNVLFSVDTDRLSQDLGIPVINYGLHAGLALDEILGEVATAAERNDMVILPLEQEYYCETRDNTSITWRARNAIAWDHRRWQSWSMFERLEAISLSGPGLLFELAFARIRETWFPRSIEDRLKTFRDKNILSEFTHSPRPTAFAYSAYHLDNLGNMQQIDGSHFTGHAASPEQKTEVCPGSFQTLQQFVRDMHRKGVTVYFANVPYVATGVTRADRVEEASRQFAAAIAPLGTVLDDRNQVMFDRKFFFNTDLHLNSEGRTLRTKSLEESMRKDLSVNQWLSARN
ncbi:hypothetical protein [Caballeronia sp. INDeC2]|uniref:hypothetical protein n=1 Tax=Caballeronia sp. INDeC2 TaxID=2921747 RepID=UPI002027D676|nr:hypothetical protein [Caballeronia sp. INDeC2]